MAQVREDAVRSVKADLALRALAEAEALEVDDEEMDAEIEAMAARMEMKPAEVRRQLDHAGRIGAVRSEQRKSKALTWLIDHVTMVDEEGNEVSHDEMAALAEALLTEDAGAEESTERKTEGVER